MIYFFTGTGNSKYVAKKLKSFLHQNVFSMNDGIKNQNFDAKTEDEVAVFCTPTYAWRMPRIVTEYIEKADFGKVKDAYFVLTCGDNTCNAYKYCKKLCDKKGWKFKGFYEIIMPNNYCIMFEAASEEEARLVINQADLTIIDIASRIRSGEEFVVRKKGSMDPVMSGIVNDAFYPFCVKSNFYVKDNCVSCGLCEKLCPLNNIKLVDGKPTWGKNCTHCSACISACPNQAIEYKGKTEGKIRYYLNVKID